jgi:probable O-glycosylation ligase (exosortase A-associated)
MITDLITLFILLIFIGFGFSRPYIALCGVVWVDVYKPQSTSYSFMSDKPLSLILTVFFLTTLIINRKSITVPKVFLYHFLMLFFIVWISLTTVYSEFPEIAWIKYDIAYKTLLLAYFIPFALNTRKSIEAFIWISIVSFGTFIFFAGVKTLMGGGGYGVDLVGSGGFMWSEGSTLANQAIALLPIFWFAAKFSLLGMSNYKYYLIAIGYGVCSLLTLVGTQARSGLVCLFVYIVLLIKQSKKKFSAVVVVCMIPLIIMPMAPDSFFERMNTMSSEDAVSSDTSALGRLVVWRWTIDYVADRPFMGGGFYAYRANAGQLRKYSKSSETEITTPHPKAFHSIIFEVLGGHGYVGLFLFLSIICHSFILNLSTMSNKAEDNVSWKKQLARGLNMSLLIYCAGGLFVGIAFYPWIYYIYGVSIALKACKV